ncbi:MAG: Uncharacterized protein FD150_1183 [Rhodobacteraceae bacterium]|nr:MAG: Uncharacterized protein FD150_1183 [Paracoccaceae bacterium]
MFPFLRVLAASLALSGCAAIVPSTAARLATFDPLTADPAAIELVVILPPGLAVSPGSARLELAAVRGSERREGSFRLADRPADQGPVVPEGASARRFAIAEVDVPRMRALQADIAAWKRTGDARGSLGLGIGGCAVGDGPAEGARGSVLIRVAADGQFLPLIHDGRLADLLGAEVLAAIKPCQGAE